MFKYIDEHGYINVPKVILHAFLALVLLVLIFGSFGTISAGERGVKTRLGNVVGVVDSGLYFKLPILEKIHKINVQTQSVVYERENPLTGASSDLQDVAIATVVNYHIEPGSVKEVYVQYNSLENFEEQVIRPRVRDTVKSVSGGFSAEQLVTKRVGFNNDVYATLIERLSPLGVIVEQVNITDFKFSPSFTQAIEAKVTAVQAAEAAKNKLEQVKAEAQQRIETAKAEAEAIKIQAQAINSQGGADYVELKKIEKWSGVGCTQYCGDGVMKQLLLTK